MPDLYLTTDELPDIKDWKVGQSYNVVLTVKMKSMSQGDPYAYSPDGSSKSDNKIRASFDITKAECEESDDAGSMSTEDFHQLKGNVMSGKKK